MNVGPPPGRPLKHQRYSRVSDKKAYDENYERIFGKKDIKDVQQGRRHKKSYVLESDNPLGGVK